MKPHEANYPTLELELGFVVFALMISQHYLYGVHYTIYMDHSLRQLMDQLNPNMRQCRWLHVVKNYNCEILYHPRMANVVAGVLSGKVTRTPIRDLCLRMKVITPLLEQIRWAQVELIKKEQQ